MTRRTEGSSIEENVTVMLAFALVGFLLTAMIWRATLWGFALGAVGYGLLWLAYQVVKTREPGGEHRDSEQD